jgi:hypothetical protein
MKFYRGPWQWVTNGESYWAPPPGFVGLDLRPLAEQAVAGGTPGLGIFVGPDTLTDKSYDLLGIGSWGDIKASQKIRDAIPGKYRPKGEDLLGVLLDIFTDGSDPDGIDGPKPIMPSSSGRMELHLGGRSHFENFRWGDRYTGKVGDLLRRDFALTMADAKTGKLRDDKHHLRCLDALCEKFGVQDWKEFVPASLQKDVPGRLKHETTYTDDFDRANAATLGASWSKIQSSGTQELGIDTNNCRLPNSGNTSALTSVVHRYDSDLSSTDHESGCSWGNDNFNIVAGSHTVGPICRKDSTATLTFYAMRLARTASGGVYTANDAQLFKFVSGTATQLGSDVSVTPSLPDPLKIYASGSTIKSYYDGVERHSQTDSAISSGLRCGLRLVVGNGVAWRGDDWNAADLAASGILYTQLERGVRGVNRGMYTQWGE